MDLKQYIRSIPDFPKEGILFRDITPLLQDKDAYHALINQMVDTLKDKQVDLIIGPEARGFVLGAAIAWAMGVGFAVARKPGKLPAETVQYTYGLEYGEDSLEIHADAIQKGQRVALVDDLLATGGTALATIRLVEQCGGEIVAVRFAMELQELQGRKTLQEYDVHAIMTY